jgi:hypothetical protein
MDNSKIPMHKRMAMGKMAKGGKVKKMMGGGMGGRSGDMMYSRGYGVGERSKRMPTMLKDRGAMKKGGEARKKKDKVKSPAMRPAARITGTRPNRPIHPSNPGNPNRPIRPMQRMKAGGLKKVDASKNPGLAKLPTSVRNKMGYMKKGGSTRNTRRMNRLEELGRVDAEKARTRRGKTNLRQERKRLVRELKKK